MSKVPLAYKVPLAQVQQVLRELALLAPPAYKEQRVRVLPEPRALQALAALVPRAQQVQPAQELPEPQAFKALLAQLAYKALLVLA